MATTEELELYYDKIQDIRKMIEEDTGPDCPCPRTNCVWHGNCKLCVKQHRLIGDHIPYCLQSIFEDKVKAIAQAVEMTVSKKTASSFEYMDYVRKKDKEQK